jgi:hypothetical protein
MDTAIPYPYDFRHGMSSAISERPIIDFASGDLRYPGYGFGVRLLPLC